MRAAVLVERDGPLEFHDDVELDSPGAGEIRGRIAVSAVCCSDLAAIAAETTPVPCIMGHEASGEVVEVGERVAELQTGDRVVLSWLSPCGACPECYAGNPTLCRKYW